MIQDKLNRINELANKAKTGGLTEEETIEQAELRKEYLADFRSRMMDQLTSIKVVNEEGKDITPVKLKLAKAMKNRTLN